MAQALPNPLLDAQMMAVLPFNPRSNSRASRFALLIIEGSGRHPE
jgi:hypothetical protein